MKAFFLCGIDSIFTWNSLVAFMRKIIGIIYGGNSEESDISKGSAQQVMNALSINYETYLIRVLGDEWTCEIEGKKVSLDKNDFSLPLGEEIVQFDAVFNAIHGDPGENGKMAAYFNMIGMSHSSCDFDAASLTFSKWQCNQVLKSLGFDVSDSYLITASDPKVHAHQIDALGFPFFLKPNKNGSSFGISKIKSREEIEPALKTIFSMDEEAIAEKLITGTEVTCAVYTQNGNVKTLPLTEIVSENEYFDYQAKYEGASQEITPARIDENQTHHIQSISVDIYKKMGLKGLVRIDYMIQNQTPVIIEINTVPGLSRESIVPKQLGVAGIDVADYFSDLLLESMNQA